jgi:hypothetical protein
MNRISCGLLVLPGIIIKKQVYVKAHIRVFCGDIVPANFGAGMVEFSG